MILVLGRRVSGRSALARELQRAHGGAVVDDYRGGALPDDAIVVTNSVLYVDWAARVDAVHVLACHEDDLRDIHNRFGGGAPWAAFSDAHRRATEQQYGVFLVGAQDAEMQPEPGQR